jgi:18S rRNA (guanine1575-N7)-methyltransferase
VPCRRGTGATFGDVVQCDMGALLPFRAWIFDACISISSLQWLCYGEEQQAWLRMLTFFTSLQNCLKPESRMLVLVFVFCFVLNSLGFF